MRKRKEEEPISIKFIFFIIFIISLTTYYIFYDSGIKKINREQTYKEMLEYHDNYIVHEEEIEEITKQKNEIETKEIENKVQYIDGHQLAEIYKSNPTNKYDDLLDKLKTAPYQSSNNVYTIVNQLLAINGYPQDIIKILPYELNQSKAKIQSSYLVANFDLKTGTLSIDESILYQIDNSTLIAILVHELDHFDKLASICRYMGVDQFQELLNRNEIYNVDTTFWRIASTFGKTNNFDGEYYKTALERFLSQDKLNKNGVYGYFYNLAENLRNPIEISAYDKSDYVYKHYGMNIEEGPTQKLIKKFNEIDWIIYDKLKVNSITDTVRVSTFDYLYSRAILSQMQNLKSIYDSCIKTKDGDMTSFWNEYKLQTREFYLNGQLNSSNYTKIMSLLKETENNAKILTIQEIAQGIANQINTLRNTKLNKNTIATLKSNTEEYLKLIKTNNIVDNKQELISNIILICIENNLYTNNRNEELSLFYLKTPEFLMELNNVKNTKQKYVAIFNNPAFKETKPDNYSEADYLNELINKYRLNVN